MYSGEGRCLQPIEKMSYLFRLNTLAPKSTFHCFVILELRPSYLFYLLAQCSSQQRMLREEDAAEERSFSGVSPPPHFLPVHRAIGMQFTHRCLVRVFPSKSTRRPASFPVSLIDAPVGGFLLGSVDIPSSPAPGFSTSANSGSQPHSPSLSLSLTRETFQICSLLGSPASALEGCSCSHHSCIQNSTLSN